MRIITLIVLQLGMSSIGLAQASNFVSDLPFPQGVSFGMNAAELEKIHPMVKYDHESAKLGKFKAYEMCSDNSGIVTGYIYHFTGEKLGAIECGRATTNMLADFETKRWYRTLVVSGGASTNMQIARMGQVFTVKRWKIKNPDMEVCFEATSESTGITFFSTDYFSFEELFPDVSDAEKQAANRRILNAAAGRPDKPRRVLIDRLSTNAPPEAALTGD